MLDFLRGRLFKKNRDCRCVELRALCDEVPRTPPGPEGSNGTGITSGAADHPEFLSLKLFRVFSCKSSVGKDGGMLLTFFSALFAENCLQLSVFSERNAKLSEGFFSLVTTEN